MNEEIPTESPKEPETSGADAGPSAEGFEPLGGVPELSREEELERQLAEAQDRYVRTLAETENFKKRVARERLEERAFAAQEVVVSLLPVADNLERALAAAKAAAGSAPADSPLGQLEKGVELTLKQFEDALRRQGVVAVDAPLGAAFDPHSHQPLVQVPDAEHEEGAVLEVLQKGWRMGDRLLRPSMVKVAAKP
jgi:molecular chaperone GrpE